MLFPASTVGRTMLRIYLGVFKMRFSPLVHMSISSLAHPGNVPAQQVVIVRFRDDHRFPVAEYLCRVRIPEDMEAEFVEPFQAEHFLVEELGARRAAKERTIPRPARNNLSGSPSTVSCRGRPSHRARRGSRKSRRPGSRTGSCTCKPSALPVSPFSRG